MKMKLQIVFEAAAILLITSEFARAQDSDIAMPADCGGTVKNMTGTIKPPTDVNGFYFPNQICQWTIPVKTGYEISLVAVMFDLADKDASNDKCYDYVSINNENMCGHKDYIQNFEPFKITVDIKFVSDSTYQKKGFEINYEYTKIPICDPECANGGTCYADNACACADGYYGFICTYSALPESATISDNTEVPLANFSSCALFGQKNIRSFDGKRIHLDGSCEYALAEFGNVKITVLMHLPEEATRNAIKSMSVTRNSVLTVRITRGDSGKMEALTENGRVLDLPEFYGPFEVTYKYGKIRVRDEDSDLIVDEDGSAAELIMRVLLETRGLCGNFNGNPDDDMQTASGNQATSIAMFESAWLQNGDCKATTSDVEQTGELDDVDLICRQMRTGLFERCLSVISTDPYIEACKQDLRLCSFMSRTGCECSSFTQYERDCAAHAAFLDTDWRNKRCGIQCPANQFYSDCAPSSPRTCKNLGSNYKSVSACTDGCTCPDGLYWDVELCVEVSNCSCYVGEVVYNSGEKLIEQCRNCTCENGKLACEDTPCDGTAIAFGNPHYLTFDGLWYTYDGVCEYTLLRIDKELDILVKSEKCGTEFGFTCIEGITITSPSFGIVLLQNNGEIKVANDAVELPHIIYNTLEIRQLTSLYVSVHLVQLGVWLRWNPDGIVFVNVPESLKGKTSGMLGNYNGETTDEYTGPDGIVQRTVQQFGSSWSARDQCSEIQTTGTDTCILQDSDREICQNAVYHHEPFKNCIGSTRHEILIRRFCQESICAARSQEEKQKNICDSLSVFATLCALKGHISNWRNETFCSVSCNNGKIYKPWASSCGRTCRGISEEDVCSSNSIMQEGCVCLLGMFEDHTGNCVQESECPCYFGNEWRNNGDSFFHNSEDCYCKGGVATCTGTPVANCTGDMIYTRCTGREMGANCQPTCANKNPTCGQECEKGCACPVGTFYDAKKTRCITEDECECTFEGKRHKHGERVIDDCDHCLCDHGQWICQRTTLCTRTCTVVSGSDFKTFDAANFRSRGTCNYTLMTDACGDGTDPNSYFDITIKSHPCEGSDYTMCNMTIRARFGNRIFTLTRGEDVKVSPLYPPKAVYMDVLFKNVRLGFHQVIEADFPQYYVQLSYDRKTTIKIEVSKNITSPIFGRKLCGLCGDLDESLANDFNTKNGETDAANFVNSWRLDENCGELKPAEENACNGNAKGEENARKQCNIMKSSLFKECHEKIDVGTFYDRCVEETCSCDTGGDCECFCTSVAAYANECGRRGAKVNWRPVTSCPVECEEFTDPTGDLCDIKYDPCNDCVKTCCNLCTRGCFEGCFPECPEGKVFDSDNQTCVEEGECVCILSPTRSYTSSAMTTIAYTEVTSVVTESTAVSTRETTSANMTAPTATTTRPCKHVCSYEENGVTVQKTLGEVWEFDCSNVTCEKDDYGCAYQDKIPLTCTTIYCEDYEEEIAAGSKTCCPSCQCKYCLHEGQKYNVSETWTAGECVTMECNEGSCPNGTVTEDKRENCESGPSSCLEFYELVTNNTDSCCPKHSCVCNVSLCPTAEACVGGSKIDRNRGNACCEVHECLPVCSYEGKEFKNGSQIRKTNCYEDYCRCTEDSCSIYTENERSCGPSPDCTNTDTNHYRHIVSDDGCCRTSNCKCECRVYGDPHYTTFDGKYYPFHGVCNYMLVTYRDSDKLQIIGHNDKCSPEIDTVSCLKDVTVIWQDTTIVLGSGDFITLDGVATTYSELPKSHNGISVKTKGQGVRLTIRAILLTLNFEHINDVSSVFIEVPMTSWFNKTVGLCGTCTNTQDDDFETKVGNKSKHSDDFASSWQYNATDKDCLPCNPPNRKECWNCSDTRHGDDIPEYCDKNCGTICSVLKSDIFSNCTREKEVYFQNCLFDEEYTPKCSVCKSSAIRAYADECDCVKWREAFNCTPTCPKGQVYKECVPECELEKSCDHLNDKLTCTQENSRGCGCPEGMVRKSANSDECVEKKCCSCVNPIPKCEEYQELTLADGEDPADCCANKSCKCKNASRVDTIECALPKVLNRTDAGTPGCLREECVCPAEPKCPDMRNCLANGCQNILTSGECNCVESVECTCVNTTCPKVLECASCSRLNQIFQAPNSDLPCGGNCCPIQECVPITCSEPPKSIFPDYPTAECPFIKRVPSSYALADTDKCCPQSYDIQCESQLCDVISSPLSCRDGFDLIVKPVNASQNSTLRNFASCPKVDECCSYKECVCTSCPFDSGFVSLGQEPIYTDGGCTKYTCNRETKMANGCYEISRQTPDCLPPPEPECYQKLNTTEALKGAQNMEEWDELCCTQYSIENSSCTDEYRPGPIDCEFPAVRHITYETTEGCENKNCPIAKCTCDKCVDSNNKTHTAGTVYPGETHCENFTCMTVEGQTCPQPEKKEVECIKEKCKEYEQIRETSNEGDCCPKQECECKPYEELEYVCVNWKNNASVCLDEENMVLQLDEGKYQDNRCCPEKSCVCKVKSELNCKKGSQCPPNHDSTVITDDTKCCPEYKCVCNCSHINCPYSSWKVQNDNDSCSCNCSCDPELCPNPTPPTCSEHEYLVQTGTKHEGCCPVYDCVCNRTSCPSLPSANCTEYQEEYEWFSDREACCPDLKKCKCNQDPLVLTKLCNESRHSLPQNCPYGNEPYIDQVMANEEEDLCCNVGCRCISCQTDSGEIKMVGTKWEEEKDCKKLRHVCSNERLSNTCHKIVTDETPLLCNYTSALEYHIANCQSSSPPSYAVETTSKTPCCPEFRCDSCNTPASCKLTETRLVNKTHPSCPGPCICSKNLTKDQLEWCKNNLCGEHQEAVFVKEGIKHEEECCPDYTCTCSKCPSDTITEEKALANKSLCEKVAVRPLDVNKTCCKNYEVQCDESCTCDEFQESCNSTVGCFTETEHNKCGCVSSMMCECRSDNCPNEQCGECYQLTSETPEADPAAACSGNCCPIEECVRKQCKSIPEPIIPPECTFLKKIEEFGEDKCCAEKKNLACNGSCPSGMTEESCLKGYELVTVLAANSSDPKIRALSHCIMIDECCPHKICVCNSCPYEEGIQNVGGSPVYSQDGCTKYTCNRETKMANGCYEISRQTPDCLPPPELECYQKLNTTEALKGAKNMEEWDELCCTQYSIENSSCTDAYRPGPIECKFPSERHITYETTEGCENKNCPIAKCACNKCVDSNNKTHTVGTVYPGETHCENFTCMSVEEELCPRGSLNSVPCPSTPCNALFERKITENIPGKCCTEERCECKSEEMLQYVCNDWVHNTSYCPDPDHMELVITGSTLQHSCCPAKTCKCMEPRNCQKGKEPVQCNNFQYEHDVYENPQDCCAVAECRCKNASQLDSQLGCNETCPEGHQQTYVDPVTKCCGKCECNACRNGSTEIISVGQSWQDKEGACSVTKVCSERKLEDGCNAIEQEFSEKDNCQSKEDYEKSCEKFEVVIPLRHLEYECCPRFKCSCTVNDTVLSLLCPQHNGITCSEYKKQVYLGEWECCNTYECQCKDCEYHCPIGLIEQKNSTQKNATTDDCCNEYSCVCDEQACQDIIEYEANNCNSPYQTAVTTSQFLDGYSCCAKYECACKNPAENCPSPIKCLASQKPVAHGKHANTSDCCDEHICQCRSSEELNTVCEYHENYTCVGDGFVREMVVSQDPCCTNFTCSCNPTTCPNIDYKCRLGYERYDAGGDVCCPNYKCRCTYCVSDGVAHAINSSWTETSCQTLTCTEGQGECPTAEARQKYQCEIVDEEDCTNRGGIIRGTDESENCCKECTLCKRVEKMQNLTMIIDEVEYLSVEEFDIGYCQGACPTIVDVNPLTGQSEGKCACCDPSIEKIAVLFEGVTGGKHNTVLKEVSKTKSCKCTNENILF